MLEGQSSRMNTDDDERTADMANPAAKYTDEFRRETFFAREQG